MRKIKGMEEKDQKREEINSLWKKLEVEGKEKNSAFQNQFEVLEETLRNLEEKVNEAGRMELETKSPHRINSITLIQEDELSELKTLVHNLEGRLFGTIGEINRDIIPKIQKIDRKTDGINKRVNSLWTYNSRQKNPSDETTTPAMLKTHLLSTPKKNAHDPKEDSPSKGYGHKYEKRTPERNNRECFRGEGSFRGSFFFNQKIYTPKGSPTKHEDNQRGATEAPHKFQI